MSCYRIMKMLDPRKSAHFVKTAKITSRVGKSDCRRGLCSKYRGIYDHVSAKSSCAFFFDKSKQ